MTAITRLAAARAARRPVIRQAHRDSAELTHAHITYGKGSPQHVAASDRYHRTMARLDVVNAELRAAQKEATP